MEAKEFFVVRHPGNKFQPKTGKTVVDDLAQAKQFATLEEAQKAATAEAVGISLYGYDNKKPVPLRHISLTKRPPSGDKE